MEKNFTKKERRALKRELKIQSLKKNNKNPMIKRVVLWSLAGLLLGGGAFTAMKLGSRVNFEASNILINAISPSDRVLGNSDSKIILVEYSDFQCPACGAYDPIVRELNKNFGDKILFSYRHFPLKQIHKNAELAARTAEAAGKQDKFWEMHDMIFENQKSWSEKSNAEDNFLDYAKTLGLDIAKFQNDLNSDAVKEKVENDYQSGIQSGVNSTPTFFLDGKKIQNPRNYDEFRNLIEAAIGSNS